MPSKEERVKVFDCDAGKELLQKFLRQIGAAWRDCERILCRRSGNRVWIYCVDQQPAEIAELLASAGRDPYHAGMMAGYIDERGEFVPSLELGWELIASKAVGSSAAVVLDEKEERDFIFGKAVKLSGNYPRSRGMLLVVNRRGEFLGWGRTAGKMLVPIADIGLYLRSRS